MLLRLNIKNFAVLENIELDLYDKLTVISGESGAGKSMLIEAMGYLGGKRASTEDIRYDTARSVIEGVFDFPDTEKLNQVLEYYNIPVDEVFIVRREIMQNKKSIIKVNNQLVTLTALREIMSEVFTIHTQDAHDDILRRENQLNYLDLFIELEEEQVFKDYQNSYKNHNSIKKRIEELEYKDRNRLEQLDNLKLQLNEISALNLTNIDEEKELEEELEYLMNYETVHETLQSIESMFNSEQSVETQLYEIYTLLDRIVQFDPNYESYREVFESGYHLLRELNSEVNRDMTNLEFDENRLNEIQERLSSINYLKRKYNETFTGLIDLQHSLEQDIEALVNFSSSYEELQVQKDNAFKEMESHAKELHKLRIDRKDFLETSIEKELQDLDMVHSAIEISVKEGQFNEKGFSNVEFLISTNKGEPMKPLNKIASGGEVSRLNLALRTIFSNFENQALVILDEIDTGVSGYVATKMAEKMKLLSKTRQVFTISHLPQAAATSDHHLNVYKEVIEGRTVSLAKYLNEEEHTYEIARMLSGSKLNEAAIINARELINSSK
ncbi:DNA repair protein RecN [Phocicoccus pinnipedialis]|uniref:DNA repair protein RecN n=1 Tax=Phocicoccus pinnipedialis TaxID=110845 RepID=A0A6V7RF91_9BACL|nr:DNA repair protein RecN [Jeotgalicoccus pinnipedialis]MBP1939327.1 DNA repair protein RecN (Recombination protein N) [Jeotgalicoccus pinnipedialis]CAD2075857.1 DNA repair protein RecN [Jeotgalicoccus pinnipedialis]